MLVLLILKWAIILSIIGLVAVSSVIIVKLMMAHNKYKHLPGPPRNSFLFGNLSLLQSVMKDETTFGEAFFELHKKYGPVVLIFALHKAVVSMTDPAIIKEVLTNDKYVKPAENYTVFVELFGERFGGYSLVSETNHEKWARHRRVLNPAFHRQYLRELMYIFNDSAGRMVQYLTTKADGKTEVSMVDTIGRVTVEAIAKAGFSMDEDMIFQKSTFRDAIALCFEAGRKVNIDPLLQYNPFKEARDYRAKTKEAIHLLRDTAERMIRQRLKDQQEGKKLPKDILSYIIKTAMVDEKFQMVEMVDDLSHFWSRLLEEIDTVIGDKEDLLYEDIAKLEYMMLCWHTVINQVLYHFLMFAGFERNTSAFSTRHWHRSKKPEELQCLGHRVPANTMLFLVTYVMCRQEQFFKDPLTFDPERFRRDEDSPLYTYFPFSMGSRSCIGQHFALIEARVVLVKLFQKLNLKLVPGQKLGMVDRLTMRPSSQCLHYITERSKSA
ncbi:putative cholesterol 24-hydroxylase isoform X2 [Apostichopus japonicus]|uniref:Putative cholesterol 24-hydroxylase isoform X2 n=1 Tax=Stichopus japonicus TaxID=307972 RepID=A0A2G8LQX1_STIJA|nr:putative cholesterol 24-hydroxylase isoform X2 [Apostichopus japonicus]